MANQTSRLAVCLAWVLKWEGSEYTNIPEDAGGPTRYGVIQTRYDEYRDAQKLSRRSVRFIEMPEVQAIYKRYYWDAIDADDLKPGYDLAMFNIAVNSGPARAKQFEREVVMPLLGTVEGTTAVLVRALCDRCEAFYHAIVAHNPSQRIFLRGWLNRLADCRHECEEAVPATSETPAAWSLMLGATALGPAVANADDQGRAYYPVRKLLNALLPDTEVDKKLSRASGLQWDGKPVPFPVNFTLDNGTAYGQVRSMATWLGLDVTVDGTDRTITLSRSSGAAKAAA